MTISDQDMQALMGAAHPEEESSPSSNGISDSELQSLMGAPVKQEDTQAVTSQQPPAEGNATRSQAVGKGVLEGLVSGIAANISDYVESIAPGALSGGDGVPYSKAFLDATPQERREILRSQRTDFVNQFYSGVDTSNHPYMNMGGKILGSIVDPTTLLVPEVKAAEGAAPLTAALQRAGQVAKFGAKLGAAQGATNFVAEHGVPDNKDEVSQAAAETAISAAYGAATGAILHLGIGEPIIALSDRIKGAQTAGAKVTPEEVLESLKTPPTSPQSAPESQWNQPKPFSTVEDITQGTPVNQIDMQTAVKIADDLNESLDLGKGPEAARDQAILDHMTGDTNRSLEMIDHDYKVATGEEPPKIESVSKPNEVVDNQPFNKPENFVNPAETEARQILEQSPELVQSIIRDSKKSMAMEKNDVESAIMKIKDGDILLMSETGKKLHPVDDYIDDGSGGSGGSGGGDGGGTDEFNSFEKQDVPKGLGTKPLTMWQLQLRPQTIWKSLGPLGEEAAEKFTTWTENIRMNENQFMFNWNKIKDTYKLTSNEEAIVRGLVNHTVPQADPRLIAAAKETRDLLDSRVIDAVKQGVLTKEKGNELIANSRKNGYFPHVYDKAFMKSEEGQAAFAKALSEVKYGNEYSAKQAVQSILGKKSISSLNNDLIKNADGTYSFAPNVYQRMWENSVQVGEAGQSAHLEKARRYPPELEPILQQFMTQDMSKAMNVYAHDTASRIETAKMWGNNNEEAARIYREMKKINPHMGRQFKDAFFLEQGDPRSPQIQSFINAPEAASRASAFLRNLQLFKLTFSGITNLTQNPINSAVLLSKAVGERTITPFQAMKIWLFGNAKGWSGKAGEADGFLGSQLRKIGNKNLADEAKVMGALGEHIYADFAGRISDASKWGKRLGQIPVIGNIIKDPGNYLDVVRFNATEDINRIQGYHFGKAYLLQLLKNKNALLERGEGKYNPKVMNRINDSLVELGLPRDTVLDNVTIKDMEQSASMIMKAHEDMYKAVGRGAQRVSNLMNFVNDAHEMPLYYNSFLGKMAWQLKRFSYGQGVLVTNLALKPARKGNILPLAVYLGLGTGVGMGINKLRNWINGDDRQMTMTKQLLDAQANMASFGILQSLLTSPFYGRGAMANQLIGPGPAQVTGAVTAVADTIKQAAYQDKYNLNPIFKEILNQVGVPGKRAMVESLRPEKTPTEAMYETSRKGKGPFESSAFGNDKEEKAPFEDLIKENF